MAFLGDNSGPKLDPNRGLLIENLVASSDGTVTFDVKTLDENSNSIEAVVVNNKTFYWSDGSQEDSILQENETKKWQIALGEFEKDEVIQIVVKTTWGSTSANTTVVTPLPDGGNVTENDYVYDYYGGVGLFDEGIYVFATSQNPRELFDIFDNGNDFWEFLLGAKTTHATDDDFISILLSRSNKPTGGYDIQVENFACLESYPVKFLFQVNFTDPGDDVMVTQALTNPIVLVLIGRLSPGEYEIEVPISQFVLHFGQKGDPYYDQILTFAPVVWEEKLVISDCSPDFEKFDFEKYYTNSSQYNGQEIIIEGYYFSGFEVMVLCEKLEFSGYAEGHLVPAGRMIWIEGGMSQEIIEGLHKQEMLGSAEFYGKIRIKGTFEYGGEYGHLGQYESQIVPNEVWLIND